MERILAVAGTRIRLVGDDADAGMLDARYAPFFTFEDGPVDATITLELSNPPTSPWLSESLTVVETMVGLSLSAPDFTATIERSGDVATLRAPRLERCVDAVLRYVLSRKLLDRGGLLLHASAVVRKNGRSWIFAGASGVGKTTISNHLPGEILCDEAVAMVCESGSLTCYATPYWTAKPRRTPVAGLVFPSQGAENRCSTISPARALAKLVSCVGPLLPSAQEAVFKASEKLVQRENLVLLDVTLASLDAIPTYLHTTLGRLSDEANAIE